MPAFLARQAIGAGLQVLQSCSTQAPSIIRYIALAFPQAFLAWQTDSAVFAGARVM